MLGDPSSTQKSSSNGATWESHAQYSRTVKCPPDLIRTYDGSDLVNDLSFFPSRQQVSLRTEILFLLIRVSSLE